MRHKNHDGMGNRHIIAHHNAKQLKNIIVDTRDRGNPAARYCDNEDMREDFRQTEKSVIYSEWNPTFPTPRMFDILRCKNRIDKNHRETEERAHVLEEPIVPKNHREIYQQSDMPTSRCVTTGRCQRFRHRHHQVRRHRMQTSGPSTHKRESRNIFLEFLGIFIGIRIITLSSATNFLWIYARSDNSAALGWMDKIEKALVTSQQLAHELGIFMFMNDMSIEG